MKKMMKTILAALSIMMLPAGAFAVCETKFINLISEPCWSCMFPVTVGDMQVVSSDQVDTPSSGSSSSVCKCSLGGIPYPGIKVSFWEPYRIVESVFDPGCFVTAGIELDFADGEMRGKKQQIENGGKENQQFFAQSHYIIMNVWYLLQLFQDFPCLSKEDYDIAYFTEIDPLWQDDLKSLIINPEAFVFGNPILGMACIADSVAATANVPRNELFWCIGNWANAYPMTGHISTSNIIKGNSGVSARMLYKMSRQGLLCDHNMGEGCQCVHTPIWQKANYRFQLLRPKTQTSSSVRLGQPTNLWEYRVTDPGIKGGENFAFLVFRKNTCCTTYTP